MGTMHSTKRKENSWTKWVFIIEYHLNGTVDKYKARLTTKGYTQTYGVGYFETFSLVSKILTIRVLFSIAANKDWLLYHFDVKNVFLDREIEEEVYMKAPPSFSEGYGKGEGVQTQESIIWSEIVS